METKKLTTLSGQGPVRRLQTDVRIEVPIARVWDAITMVDHVQHWWTGGTIEDREGGAVVLGDGSELNGTIKAMMAPYIFEFTSNDSPGNAHRGEWLEHRTKSLVRYDLVELGDESTHLTLIQYSPEPHATGAAAGWHHIVGERLKNYLECGSVRDDDPAERFEQLKTLYGA